MKTGEFTEKSLVIIYYYLKDMNLPSTKPLKVLEKLILKVNCLLNKLLNQHCVCRLKYLHCSYLNRLVLSFLESLLFITLLWGQNSRLGWLPNIRFCF